MHDAYLAIRECGWAAWLCVLLALPAFAAATVGLVLRATKARAAAWIAGTVAVGLGLCAFGIAVFGRQNGLARTEAALSGNSIDPSMKARIRAVGLEDANQCLKVGGATGGLPLVLGAIAVGVGLATRKQASS